jgi:hypothetical protein
LIAGLALALVSGGLAWLNFTFAMNAYVTTVASLLNEGVDPAYSRRTKFAINLTLLVTPAVATASL